jgi:hypothetical protein
MADNDPIRIGRTNNIESNNPGTGTVLGRAANSPRTDPVFTVRTPVGGDGIHGEASANNNGVVGFSGSSFGVFGSSNSSVGAGGNSSSNFGVQGVSDSSLGVAGFSTSFFGTFGSSTNSTSERMSS